MEDESQRRPWIPEEEDEGGGEEEGKGLRETGKPYGLSSETRNRKGRRKANLLGDTLLNLNHTLIPVSFTKTCSAISVFECLTRWFWWMHLLKII